MGSSLLRELEGLGFLDEDMEGSLVQSCEASLSPFGDVLVLAHKLKLAFLTSRGKSPGLFRPRVFDRCCPGLEGDAATAVLCLPVADSRGSSSAAAAGRRSDQVVWHCAVVGYASGVVEVVSEEGECLARRRVLEFPVRAVRSSVSTAVGVPRLDGTVPVEKVPAVADVLVVYDSTLVTLTGAPLCETLRDHRRRAAEARAAGEDGLDEETLAGLFCKKFHFREQSARDACILRCPNRDFDRLCHLSYDSRINETHFRSLTNLTYIISVGSNPWLQYSLPYNYKHPDINELAENVVSTVKSGLFRAATGMFFGGGGEKKEEEKPRDPEQKLVVSHQFTDPAKAATRIEFSPNNLHLAVVDAQNRVLVVDALSGIVVNVWKGYHHVQVGWLAVNSRELPEDSLEPHPADNRVCCLLAIYLPRRGSLELVSVEKKERVAEFSVCKRGRLVTAHNGVLDAAGRAVYSRTGSTCLFMDGGGRLMRIVVPFHSIMTQSAASHDLIQQQKLGILLGKIKKGPESSAIIKEATELIVAGRTTSGRLAMLVEFLGAEGVSSKEGHSMLDKVRDTLSPSKESSEESSYNPSRAILEELEALLKLYDLLKKHELSHGNMGSAVMEQDDSDAVKKKTSLTKWTKTISENINEGELSSLTLREFTSWFVINPDISSERCVRVRENPPKPEVALAIFGPIVVCCTKSGESLRPLVKTLSVRPTDLISLAVAGMPSWNRNVSRALHPFLDDFFQLAFSIAAKEDAEDVNMPRLDLVGKARALLASAPISPQLYSLLYHFHSFVVGDPSLGRLCSRETDMMAESCDSALHLQEAFGLLLESASKEPMTDWRGNLTVRSLFDEGDGRVAEVVAKWLAERDFGAKDVLRSEEVGAFLNSASQKFPRSMRKEVVLSHLAWELAQRWSQRRTRLDVLEEAANCLDALLDDLEFPGLGNFVAILMWKTFLARYVPKKIESSMSPTLHAICLAFLFSAVRDAANHTENRFSSSRCLREVGVPPTDLPRMLLALARVARFILQSDGGDGGGGPLVEEEDGAAGKKKPASSYYDEGISFDRRRRHLLDHARDPDDSLRRLDSESMALHFQFAVCCCLILRFGVDDLRPLRLFSPQEANHFLRDGGGGGGVGMNLGVLSMVQAGSVRKSRYHLIRAATAGAVSCIHYVAPGQVDADEYR